MGLGNWAVLDIETTGVNPATDEIIDLGYLQFEGLKLVRSYLSLVRPEHQISSFITKLTGITNADLRKAPLWTAVKNDLLELESHALVAHNAKFEESFLKRYFDEVTKEGGRESYQDSIYYLALIFPESSSLSLETFINALGISNKEEHRGLSDSRDLLKTLLLATYLTHQDKSLRLKLAQVLYEFPDDFFFKHFFQLSVEDLEAIAQEIDYSVQTACKNYLLLNRKEPIKIDPIDRFSKEFSGKNIQDILRDEEAITEILPNYKYRNSQEQLSVRVGQAFKNNIHALIQAPTGTGKTIGYLIPSFLFSTSNNQSCLIATGTKTLQDQALSKDVPQVKRLMNLGEEAKVVKLIGSSNHLCELLFREQQDEKNLIVNFNETYTRAYFEMLFFYNSRVAYEKKLTREQIPYVLKKTSAEFQEKEASLAVDYRACVGQSCPLANQCSYLQGLREAKDARVIVGNHALMLNWPKSIPRPGYIVVDEAHRIENEATKAYSMEVHHKNLDSFLKTFPQGMGALIYLLSTMEDEFNVEDKIQTIREQTQFNLKMIRDHVEPLPGVVESLFKKLPSYSAAYSNEMYFPKKNELKDSLSAAIYNHSESLCFILESLFALFNPYITKWELKDFKNEPQKLKAWAVFESNVGLLEKLLNYFKHFLESPSDWCTVLRFNEKESFSIESSPVDVGKKIYEELLSPSQSVVFTSATLGNASGDLGTQGVEWMTGYSYLPTEKRFKSGLFLDAVFDYTNKSKVFISSDTRSINDSLFVPELLKHVCPVINFIGGRTLLLFSSKVRFEMASEIILNEFDGKIPVFIQGLGKNVIEDFKKESAAVLVGMESFGEGIDIPGDRLSFILIDKIPDVRQDLVVQKRREFFDFKFGNEFNDYFLATRTRSLHQKFGRLLRSENDHGVILLVDNRIKKWKGNTLKTFQKLMEPYRITNLSLADACREIQNYFSNKFND